MARERRQSGAGRERGGGSRAAASAGRGKRAGRGEERAGGDGRAGRGRYAGRGSQSLAWYLAGGDDQLDLHRPPRLEDPATVRVTAGDRLATVTQVTFSNLTVNNYVQLLSGNDILRNVLNSLIVAVVTAALTAVVATLAGYGFGRFRFRGSAIAFCSSCWRS